MDLGSKRFVLNIIVSLPDRSVSLGLNTDVTLRLRLNASFEFASVSAPRLKTSAAFLCGNN